MVQTQGKVDIANASIELGSTRDEVRELIRNLVGKQLFSGYVDWDGGVLYSVEASKIKDGTCPKCGGKIELAGKGIVKCAYCGSEVFLTT
jgi:DNA-directed RNA polymerase subunit RPC12/RpoP